MEKPSTKKPMNVLKTMVFLKNFMEFTISNKYTNRYIKIINVDYIEIIETGSPPEQGFGDTRKQYIKYSINKEPPLKFYKLEFDPGLDKLQIFK